MKQAGITEDEVLKLGSRACFRLAGSAAIRFLAATKSSWPTWYRHMLYVFIAHFFVIELWLITASLTGDRSTISKELYDISL